MYQPAVFNVAFVLLIFYVPVRRSLPAVSNVAFVLLIFMYLWAIVGMNLFGNLKQAGGNAGINRLSNFQHFPVAMITEAR